ncbi:hypothetical protein GQ54DRAFT_298491 [Martensiomyces pterosporus]|nr:hypothetical protein GQ54DRAFT_298491 [Martensiomyces pterosporus]
MRGRVSAGAWLLALRRRRLLLSRDFETDAHAHACCPRPVDSKTSPLQRTLNTIATRLHGHIMENAFAKRHPIGKCWRHRCVGRYVAMGAGKVVIPNETLFCLPPAHFSLHPTSETRWRERSIPLDLSLSLFCAVCERVEKETPSLRTWARSARLRSGIGAANP